MGNEAKVLNFSAPGGAYSGPPSPAWGGLRGSHGELPLLRAEASLCSPVRCARRHVFDISAYLRYI